MVEQSSYKHTVQVDVLFIQVVKTWPQESQMKKVLEKLNQDMTLSAAMEVFCPVSCPDFNEP